MDSSGSGPQLVTELRHDRDLVEFLVHTDDALYQDRLIKMGWQPTRPGRLSRRLSTSADIDRIFGNFTTHIEEMIEQSARMRPIAWRVALTEFMDRTQGSGLRALRKRRAGRPGHRH